MAIDVDTLDDEVRESIMSNREIIHDSQSV